MTGFLALHRCRPVAATVLVLLATGACCGQAGLRESLERLDRDGDGSIEPHEITPLARPYLERVAKVRRMSLERSYRVDYWQEAARAYYAIQNGAYKKDVQAEIVDQVRSFGPDPDEPIVPGFGLAEVKYPYIQADLDEADRTLRRGDRNKNGHIDASEVKYVPWTHRNPFADDLDGDNRLSRLELGQRYARRRLLDGSSDELVQKARRVGSGVRDSRTTRSSSSSRSSTRYLPATILSRFDRNRNGRLESEEVQPLGIPAGKIDTDRDSELSRAELEAYFEVVQESVADVPEGLPPWFFELDANRDEQVALSEFASDWTEAKVDEFAAYDLNRDGLLTASEVLRAATAGSDSYENAVAEVLPPRKTVVSEIEVDDDFVIGDLNVQLSITHTYVSYLDAYLTGPDGQRIELFTAVGAHDDHFDETIFDDQSRYPITKARPPFRGTFLPEGLTKKQPGLSAFNGKSVKGVWQLIIRGSRSDRFGMLHHWKLLATPADRMGEEGAVATTSASPSSSSPVPQVSPSVMSNRGAAVQVSRRRGTIVVQAEEQEQKLEAAYADAWRKWKERMGQLEASARPGMSDEERAQLNSRREALNRYRQILEAKQRGDYDKRSRKDEKLLKKQRE